MHFITEDKKALAALQEAVKELPSLSKMEGTYTLIPCSEGLKITNREIHYADLRCLLRAIGLVATGVTEAAEKPNYQILGAMPDASRNAVPKVETLKKLFLIVIQYVAPIFLLVILVSSILSAFGVITI